MLPKRWIVERLFAHLMRGRRLARDYERRTASAEAMVYWSMTMPKAAAISWQVTGPCPSRARPAPNCRMRW
ncbi:hypothetical protein ABH927_006581 [Planotetraspora sp. GP83]